VINRAVINNDDFNVFVCLAKRRVYS